MAVPQFTNNASTTLAAGISSGTTTILLATGTGAEFPSPGVGQYFSLTLNDAATGQVYEVCYCTARTGDSLTVTRGQEGTSARAWLLGDFAYGAVTAGQLTNFLGWQTLQTIATGTVATQTIQLPAPYRRFRLTLQGAIVTTAGAGLQAQFSSDGGSTFLTTASYTSILNLVDSSGTASVSGGVSFSAMTISVFLPANNVLGPWDIVLEIWPGTSSSACRMYGIGLGQSNSTASISGIFSGAWGGTPALMNAIRIGASSGNMNLTAIVEGLV